MDPQYFLVILVVIIMGWFAYGVISNLRRGDALLKWLQRGLPRIGERTTFRWMGTSVAELVINRARSPFRRLETLLVFKPRDVFWMTALAALQGRQDLLLFRAQLGTPPLLDLELADSKSWTGRSALKAVERRGWETTEYRGLRLMAPRGFLPLATQTLDRLSVPMARFAPRYARFSLRKNEPNLEVHVPFPVFRDLDAVEYIESLRDLAQAIAARS